MTSPPPPTPSPPIICTPEPSPKGNSTQLTCPDTVVRERRTSSLQFRTAELDEARRILSKEVPHLKCLPLDSLWASFLPDDTCLVKIKSSLAVKVFRDGQWNREKAAFLKRGEGEVKVFSFFSDIFDEIQALIPEHARGCVIKMIDTGSYTPISERRATCRPDAFLIARGTPDFEPLTESPYYWRDLTCPFEYKFGNGDEADVGQYDLSALANKFS